MKSPKVQEKSLKASKSHKMCDLNTKSATLKAQPAELRTKVRCPGQRVEESTHADPNRSNKPWSHRSSRPLDDRCNQNRSLAAGSHLWVVAKSFETLAWLNQKSPKMSQEVSSEFSGVPKNSWENQSGMVCENTGDRNLSSIPHSSVSTSSAVFWSSAHVDFWEWGFP